MNTILEKRNAVQFNAEEIENISSVFGIDKKLAALLFSRGISSENAVRSFLFPDSKNFYDPFMMKGMPEAVERITDAINNNEKIVIYGDYDADGICANAILSLYFTSLNIDIYSHTPNRMADGYGLNNYTLEKIIERVMPDLIITCDCGISAVDEVEFVKDLGVDIIVTDHHEAGETIPDCIVINPKQAGCGYPFKGLCGAGVVLKLVQALSGYETMVKYLDLCAIATVADLVPLLDENRLIVQLGLQKLTSTENFGLKALFESNNIYKPTASDVAFKISPRINAAGRMGDAYRAYELLTTGNRGRIFEIIEEIEADNLRRKELFNEMYTEALEDLKFEDLIDNRAVILCNNSWEKGITGILAAKLSGDFVRPAFILAKSGDCYKGTCRSIDGINIYDVLSECADLLIEYGGHSQAAGFSIMPENIDDFKLRLHDILLKFDENLFLPKKNYDLEIDIKDIDLKFVESLEMLEPTGNSNPKPTFKITAENLSVSPCKNNQAHVSINAENILQIFAFNYALLSYQLMGNNKKELVVELQRNNFGGNDIKGILKACAPQELFVNDMFADSYNLSLSASYSDADACFKTYENIDEVYDESLFGTLVVADNSETYRTFIERHAILINEYMYVTSVNNYSRIIVAPDFEQADLSLANYNRIIFLFKPYDDGVISFINSRTKASVFIPVDENRLPEISSDRKVFMDYYDKIKIHENEEYKNITVFYRKLKREFPECNYAQLVACLAVFKQMHIIDIGHNPFSITNNRRKAELSDSSLYRSILKEEQKCLKPIS